MEKNNIIKKFAMIWVILSLVFIMPLNLNFVFAGTASQGALNSVCAGAGSTSIKDSLLMSIVTMCLPGILEKTKQFRDIKCETAVCYYDAVKSHLDPSFCMKSQAYQTCAYVVGDVFALPGLNIFDYYRKMFADVMANPIGTILSYGTKLSRGIVTGSCNLPVGCTATNPPYMAAATFLVIMDGASLIQQIKDILKNGFFPPLHSKSACDRLPAIKKEMDQILAVA